MGAGERACGVWNLRVMQKNIGQVANIDDKKEKKKAPLSSKVVKKFIWIQIRESLPKAAQS